MVDAIVEGIKDRVAIAIKTNQSVGVQVPENRHNDLLEAIFNTIKNSTNSYWTFTTISQSYDFLLKNFKQIIDLDNVNFIDCISKASGIKGFEKDCTYIESPTLLEKISLEVINSFEGIKKDAEKFIVIDSLSAMVIHNDSDIVREFISLLMNRARSEDIHLVSILVEEERESNRLIQLNDKIVVLRDSFID